MKHPPPGLLLDTHAFLFAIREPDRLSAKLRKALLDPSIPRWVSVVSLWEIGVKVQIGKSDLPHDAAFFERHLKLLQAKSLVCDWRHSARLLHLPLLHKDPFDRLLIAQAIEEI